MFWDNWGLNFNMFNLGNMNPFACCGTPFDSAFQYRSTFGIFSMLNPEDAFVYQAYAPYLYGNQPCLPQYSIFSNYNNMFSNYQSNNLYNLFESAYNSGLSYGQRLNTTGLLNYNNLTNGSYLGNTNFGDDGVQNDDEVGTRRNKRSVKRVKIQKDKLGKEFLARVKQIARNINCDYDDILAVINSESSFSTTAGYNQKTGKIGCAVGLIQFTDPAIRDLNQKYGLNLTKEKILRMSALEQLDLAEKFWKLSKGYANMGNKKLSAADLYAITFLTGRANREVLCVEGEVGKNGKLLNYYEQNRGLDLNGDKKITKSELAQRLDAKRVDESSFA